MEGFHVLLEVCGSVIEGDVVLLEEGVNLEAGFVSQHAADLLLEKLADAVAFDGEGFEGGAGGVFAGRDELGGEGVRDVEGHLHGERIAGLRLRVAGGVLRFPHSSR